MVDNCKTEVSVEWELARERNCEITYLCDIGIRESRGAKFLQEFNLATNLLIRVVLLVRIPEVVAPELFLEARILGQSGVLMSDRDVKGEVWFIFEHLLILSLL